jgi:hypothetical protein
MNKENLNINTLDSCKIFLRNSEIECKDMLLIVKNLNKKGIKITLNNLSLCRLESLLRAIAIKRSMLEHIDIEELRENKLDDLIEKLEHYTNEVNNIIKEFENSIELSQYFTKNIN